MRSPLSVRGWPMKAAAGTDLGADDLLLDRDPSPSGPRVWSWARLPTTGNDALDTYRRLNAASLHTIETWEHLTASTDIDT